MGHYKHNGDGDLSLISGRGRAEYGASTVRKGTVNIPKINAGDSYIQEVSVSFTTPMPDADYIVVIDELSAVNVYTFRVYNKTANGFTLNARFTSSTTSPTATSDVNGRTVYFTAFKLYTDTEYNRIIDDVAELNEKVSKLDGSWVDISSDASDYISSGYIKYKKIGQLVIVKMWDVIFKGDGSGNILSNNLPTCDDNATNRIFRDQREGLGALYMNNNSKNLYCHHTNPSGDTTQTKWYGEMIYTTSD